MVASLSPAQQIMHAAEYIANQGLSSTAAINRLREMYSLDTMPEARRLYMRARLFLTEGMDLPPAAKKEYLRRKLFEKAMEGLDSDDIAERRLALAFADRVAEDPEIGLRKPKSAATGSDDLDVLKDILDLPHEVTE